MINWSTLIFHKRWGQRSNWDNIQKKTFSEKEEKNLMIVTVEPKLSWESLDLGFNPNIVFETLSKLASKVVLQMYGHGQALVPPGVCLCPYIIIWNHATWEIVFLFIRATNISTDCYWAICFHFLISCILHSSAWASLADNQTCTALDCTDRTYVVRPMSHKQLLKPTKLCSLQKAVVFILIAFIGARSGTLCLQN